VSARAAVRRRSLLARVSAGISGACADAETGPSRRAAANAERRVRGVMGQNLYDDRVGIALDRE
jgi:hypothetical protein